MLNAAEKHRHQNPTLAVDLGLICLDKGQLKILLMARPDERQVGGAWALPGGIVHIDETIDDTAMRVLSTKANLENFHLEQLQSFGALDRDPRGRVVSVAYFALTPFAELARAVETSDDLMLARIDDVAATIDSENAPLSLAFDHAHIIEVIMTRLRGKIGYTPIALSLLPEFFTLREVQEVYETILNTTFAKPAFRRKLLDRGIIEPTGRLETASAFRPAELYQRLKPTGDL